MSELSAYPLEYASSNTEGRWGKFVIRPSRRTILFLMLLAFSIVWLARRHEPWLMTAAITTEGNNTSSPLITPDGRLLCDNRTMGLATIDLDTGEVVTRIVPPSPNPNRNFIPIGDGDRVVDASGNGRTMTVYSTASGKAIAELLNPQSINPAYRPIAISPDTKRVLTGTYPNIFLWDISGDKPGKEMALLGVAAADKHTFTNDQKRIVGFGGRVVIVDANDGRLIYSASEGQKVIGVDPKSGTFGLADGAGPTEIRSTWDAKLITTYPPPAIKAGSRLSWSPDLKHLFIQTYQPGASRRSAPLVHFDLVDAASGKSLKRVTYPGHKGFELFPDHRRYLLTAPQSIEIYDLNKSKPISIIRPAGITWGNSEVHFAPDGNTLLIFQPSTFPGVGSFSIYRRAGWDCPESTWGILAFPATWLLIYSLIAAGLSFMRDARRQVWASSPQLSPWFLYIFWAITLALTIHVIIEACRGVWVRSPAPLLLIGACALASGSRIWRIICMILLAHTLFWCFVAMNWLRQAQGDAYPFFDRVYEFPPKFRMGILTAAMLGMATAIGVIVVSVRSSTATNSPHC